MPTFRSRETPAPGSSVSERHHDFWKDQVERERHIRERWHITYGGFYYQKPCFEEPYYGPVYAPVPAVREVNYLAESDVPKSEPMAYLRACIKKQEAAAKTIAADSMNRKCVEVLKKYVPGQYVNDKVKPQCNDLPHSPLEDSDFQKFKPVAVKYRDEYVDATFTENLHPNCARQAARLQPSNYLDLHKSTADCQADFELYPMPPKLYKLAQRTGEVNSHPYKMSSVMYNCVQHTGLPRLPERSVCRPVQPEFTEYCPEHCGSLCGPVGCSTVRKDISNFSGRGVYPYVLERSVEDKPKTRG